MSKEVMKKIAALLDRAESTDSTNEATVCAEKASQLLEKYNLSMIDVEEHKRDDPVNVRQEALYCWVSNSWIKEIATAAGIMYGVEVVWVKFKNKYIFDVIGRESAIETWLLMTPYLIESVKRTAKALRERKVTEEPHKRFKGLGAFERAVANALAVRMRRAGWQRRAEVERVHGEAGVNALVPVDAIDTFMTKMFGEVHIVSERKKRTTHEAVRAAQEISLSDQIAENDDSVKQIAGK